MINVKKISYLPDDRHESNQEIFKMSIQEKIESEIKGMFKESEIHLKNTKQKNFFKIECPSRPNIKLKIKIFLKFLEFKISIIDKNNFPI